MFLAGLERNDPSRDSENPGDNLVTRRETSIARLHLDHPCHLCLVNESGVAAGVARVPCANTFRQTFWLRSKISTDARSGR